MQRRTTHRAGPASARVRHPPILNLKVPFYLLLMLGTSKAQTRISSASVRTPTVDRFLLHIFGSEENLEHAAISFFASEDLEKSAISVKEPWPTWTAVPTALRHPVELLWLRLMRILGTSRRLPITARSSGMALAKPAHCVKVKHSALCLPPSASGFGGKTHPSIFRGLREEWLPKYASDSAMRELLGGNLARCIETGDGHYLPAYPSCREKITVDRFEPKSDFKLDLNTPLALASAAMQRLAGSSDMLHSHDVFEHLESPEVAIHQLAHLLRVGGALVWSAPLMKEEHGWVYGDWQRYTTQILRKLLHCAGFDIVYMHGLGTPVATVAYLYGFTAAEFTVAELNGVVCDASKDRVPAGGTYHNLGCRLHRYSMLACIATKRRSVSLDEHMRCVMGSASEGRNATWLQTSPHDR